MRLADRPVPSDFTPQLRRIVESFGLTGMGPAEAEVEVALASGEPARLHALGARLEGLYPADLRRFLDGKGFGRLYREDLADAAGRLARASVDARPGRPPRQERGRFAWRGVALLLAIGVVALAVWYLASVGRLPTTPDPGPLPRSAAVAAAPPAAAPPLSGADQLCRARLKARAVAWCVRTFGAPTDPAAGVEGDQPLPCGDTLAVRAATVRIVLDRLFADGVEKTYTLADMPARCDAAAEIALVQTPVPGAPVSP